MTKETTIVKESRLGNPKTYHRYNAVTHGIYFSGIMRCSICKIKKCPLRKEGELCAKELFDLKDIENMKLDDLREKVVLQFGKLLILMLTRLQIQSGFGTVSPQIALKILEMSARFTTSSKGGIKKASRGLADLLIEEKEKETKEKTKSGKKG